MLAGMFAHIFIPPHLIDESPDSRACIRLPIFQNVDNLAVILTGINIDDLFAVQHSGIVKLSARIRIKSALFQHYFKSAVYFPDRLDTGFKIKQV